MSVGGGDDGGVRIAVRDDGPGIAPEHHGLIFEKFGRAGTGQREARHRARPVHRAFDRGGARRNARRPVGARPRVDLYRAPARLGAFAPPSSRAQLLRAGGDRLPKRRGLEHDRLAAVGEDLRQQPLLRRVRQVCDAPTRPAAAARRARPSSGRSASRRGRARRGGRGGSSGRSRRAARRSRRSARPSASGRAGTCGSRPRRGPTCGRTSTAARARSGTARPRATVGSSSPSFRYSSRTTWCRSIAVAERALTRRSSSVSTGELGRSARARTGRRSPRACRAPSRAASASRPRSSGRRTRAPA